MPIRIQQVSMACAHVLISSTSHPRIPKTGMQENSVGYDSNGVGRIVVLALMSMGTVLAMSAHGASKMMPERIARPIEFYKDVLRNQ
jgi:hypothetical protein